MSKQAKNYLRGKKNGTNHRNRNGDSRRPKGKGSYQKEDNEYSPNASTHNDISWYVADNQILNDAARLPYSVPTGMPFSRPFTGQGATGEDVSSPGVLAMRVMPTLGYASNPNDPVNVAAQGIYSFVRHLNSGARNYDPVDLMLYIAAMDSVYSILSWATRLYATICSYTQGNRYLPRVLFAAQGVDFTDFANNMVSFRAQLNQRIAKASQLMVPNIMPLFERHRWLFANYYIEGDSMKDQIYLYKPAAFYKFALDSDGAGMLNPVILSPNITVSQLMTYIDGLLDPIIADEDFNIMSGDIYKAYGGKVVTMSLVPDLITMDFTYDEKVLLQFKNAKCKSVAEVGSAFKDDFFQIHQDTGKRYLVVENPNSALVGYRQAGFYFINIDASATSADKNISRAAGLMWSKPILLTSPHSDVSPDENMINTRGTMACEFTQGSGAVADTYRFFYGSEWYLDYEIWRIIRNRSNNVVVFNHYSAEYINVKINDISAASATIMTNDAQASDLIAILTKFKFHPEYFMINVLVSSGGYVGSDNASADSLFEIDNYSLVDYNVIKGMHDAALLGEFNVPRIALVP